MDNLGYIPAITLANMSISDLIEHERDLERAGFDDFSDLDSVPDKDEWSDNEFFLF